MKQTEQITIELLPHEALVLFDWLTSLNLKGHGNEPDDATQQLLWEIEGFLEKQLAAVIDPKYKTLLAEAKARMLSAKSNDAPPSVLCG